LSLFSSITFMPMLSGMAIALLFAGITISGILGILRFNRSRLRLIAIIALLLFILNPVQIHKTQSPISDIALIILDDSQSMQISGRDIPSEQAVQKLKEKLINLHNTEVITARLSELGDISKTDILPALQQAISKIPANRFAGAFIVSDGRFSDIQQNPDAIKNLKQKLPKNSPLHFVLPELDNEKDIWLEVIDYDKRGLVSDTAKATIKAHTDGYSKTSVDITVTSDSGGIQHFSIPPNTDYTLELPLTHAGKNEFRIDALRETDELSHANNSIIISIPAIRDRMKVLLVTGKVYAGQRVWRNYLKSDTAIELTHFNILRNIMDSNIVPSNEMSLIPFPVDDLFNRRLPEFDLIIIDQFPEAPGIPDAYLSNLASYIRKGGSLLFTIGAMNDYNTITNHDDFASILPFYGQITEVPQAIIPKVTTEMLDAPIVQALARNNSETGKWYRYFAAEVKSDAQIAIETSNGGAPLLLLNSANNGRVATLMSDQLWLWARNHDGGGPYKGLVRNIIHWLLRHPDMEEKLVQIRMDKNTAFVSTRKNNPDIKLIMPDGRALTPNFIKTEGGVFTAQITNAGYGIITAYNNTRTEFHKTYQGDGAEYMPLSRYENYARDITKITGGGIFSTSPIIKKVRSGISGHSSDYAAIIANEAFETLSTDYKRIIPEWILLAAFIMAILLGWHREKGHL